ncbi:MAG: beta-ketoacyl synthase chain length factor [Deltaproteobacteria bacterium]|jgi:hypothetical protein|nr:beta-ketoacyl synthase chain length factor [Deltaproteobacteria bacterium]
MKPIYVRGLGLWTPGFASPEAWCRGEPDAAADAPEVALLSGALRRRATGMTRMAVEVLHQAIRELSFDASAIPIVWATAHGEHSTAIKILGMMRSGEGKLSPTHFHNSVHNTASGYASIALRNCSPSTTITGGVELVASSFLEAACHLETGAEDAVVVLADEPLQPPFDCSDAAAPLALAFCLSTRSEGASAVLTDFRRDAVAPVKHCDRFGPLYVEGGRPLLERIVRRRPGTVALEVVSDRSGPVHCVDLELVGD